MNYDKRNDDGDRIIRRVTRGVGGSREVEVNLDRLCAPAPRYTDNDEILTTERELREDGVELENPALPLEEHPTAGTIDAAECRRRIEAETDADDPRRDRIAGLNRRIANLEDA